MTTYVARNGQWVARGRTVLGPPPSDSPRVRLFNLNGRATQTPVDLRPSGPEYLRYEDVNPNGTMSLQDVFDAAGATKPVTQEVKLTFPAGRFSFTDYVRNNIYGVRVPANVGIYGSGKQVGGTEFYMTPFGSTKASSVPVQGSKGTNPLVAFGIQNTGSSGIEIVQGLTWKNFSVVIAPQGHNTNGIGINKGHGFVMENVYLEGHQGGPAASPPEETFGLNLYRGEDHIIRNVEVDGRRTRYDGSTTSVCCSPIGMNDADNWLLDSCNFHDNQWGMPTTYQTPTFGRTVNCRSVNNKTGFNHERNRKITHENIYVSPLAGRPHHFSMTNDQYDGVLTVSNPTWTPSSGSASGKIVIFQGSRGSGLPDLQTSNPIVTDANGNSIMSQVAVIN